MKVLLTGASGFVGSHVLDRLKRRSISTAVLLRSTSSSRFIKPHLGTIEVRQGAIDDAQSLKAAMEGITHVIHCAGATKAAQPAGFYEVNQAGARRMVDAANEQRGVEVFLLVSSLAAAGPGTAANPACETSTPAPVTHYGQSKLKGEEEVRIHCRSPYVIIRPPAVYGPRDDGFLPLFQAASRGILPWPGDQQKLSLVYVEDLAEAIVHALLHPKAHGETYFAANSEVTSARGMAMAIQQAMGKRCVRLPLPKSLLWATCMLHDLRTRVTGKPHILSRHKYREIEAAGWVCATRKLEQDLGFNCNTGLQQGVQQTVAWYRDAGWI